MKKLLIYSLGLVAAQSAIGNPPSEMMKPNILLIITDDQGYSDFGFMENPVLRTPNIDRLAQSGAVFRNFVTGAACSPGRAMIFTGRNHLLAGVWGVPPRQNLRTDEVMMPAFFKAAGYETFYIGKNDCVAQHHVLPWFAGWNDVVCGAGYVHLDAIHQYKPAGAMPLVWGNKKQEGWTAEIHTEEAVRFIKEKKEEPWLLTMAYIIPHTPWSPADERYAPYYRDQGCSENIAACYSHIEQMDHCVGQMLDTLEETGQRDRTLIIYLSDNGQTAPDLGGMNKEGYIESRDWSMRNTAGLRGSKALVWENGIRVPLIVSMPGSIATGDRDQFGAAEDLLPTVLDYAGIPASIVEHKPFCGVSLRPALDQAKQVFERPAVFRMTIWGDGMPLAPKGYVEDPASLKFEDHHMTLRGAKFKLHARPGGKVELYDVVIDMKETKEISAEYPEITERMLAECRRQWAFAISEGEAFRMAEIVVGDPSTWKYPDGTFWGYASKVQKTWGGVTVGALIRGFADEGDRAVYKLDVVKGGDYSISLKGLELNRAGHLIVKVGGQKLTVQKVTDDTIEFGTAHLPEGVMELEIVAGKPAERIQPVQIERILFSLK